MSGLLSVLGWKVLHIDRNNYYGGDCASLNLTNLYAKVSIDSANWPRTLHPFFNLNPFRNIAAV